MTRIDFVKHAILKARRSHILNALFIVLAIAVPTLLRFAIDPFVQGGLRYIAYVGTIMFAAVFLGWRAAVLTTLGSMIVANLLFIRIRSSTWSPGEITIGLILFGCSAALLIVLGQTLRRTVIELDATACQTAFKRDPRSASKRDPLFG